MAGGATLILQHQQSRAEHYERLAEDLEADAEDADGEARQSLWRAAEFYRGKANRLRTVLSLTTLGRDLPVVAVDGLEG